MVPSVDNTALGQLGTRTAALAEVEKVLLSKVMFMLLLLNLQPQFCVYCTPGPSQKISCTM